MGILCLKTTLFRHRLMNNTQLKEHIEALLFVEGSMPIKTLAKLLESTEEEVAAAAQALGPQEGRGVVVVSDGKSLELRTAPSVAEKIEAMRKDELSKDIGRAGLEVLSAVLYRGPLTRSEIDFIRGVNSSQTLRGLLMRGLVRKVPNPKDERSFLYEPTTELLGHLGLTTTQELPEFEEVRAKLATLEDAYRNKEAHAAETQ